MSLYQGNYGLADMNSPKKHWCRVLTPSEKNANGVES